MQKIESVKNDQIKKINKLKQKKYRQQEGQYLLEGWHVIKEVLVNRPEDVELILTVPDHLAELRPFLKANSGAVIEINERVATVLSDTVHTDGIFAVAQLPGFSDETLLNHENKPWLVLDQVQDPGNAGTMVRTADAAGFAGVIFSAGAIDPFNSKVVRSMQGSQFHLVVAQVADLNHFLEMQRQQNYRIFGTLVDNQATDIRQITLSDQRYLLMMGNEAHGLSSELATIADDNLYLPIFGQAESLNVAIAAAVLMYQLQMQADL
ncbi:TrmH family RNA methyltransferase [Lapidilactobacillus bayanensis]|uniref:TrmH family RNA methyltransferase n=1 Tax=Lapidilactobacillus bayanensis TaxID=2485998 RepID=UPI0013DDBA91|nr:RNA methyltransferase [Lapidilactobacillus bayanensis]